eukprot:UN28391
MSQNIILSVDEFIIHFSKSTLFFKNEKVPKRHFLKTVFFQGSLDRPILIFLSIILILQYGRAKLEPP